MDVSTPVECGKFMPNTSECGTHATADEKCVSRDGIVQTVFTNLSVNLNLKVMETSAAISLPSPDVFTLVESKRLS